MRDFYEAFINRRHVVLGRKLAPFCLKHCLYLEAIDSPVMGIINGEERNLSRADLEKAVLICSAKDPLSALDCRVSHLCLRWHGFRRGCAGLMGYLQDYVTVPELWVRREGRGNLNAPWILSKAAMLLSRTSLRVDEIWTLPLGELLWYCAAMAELEGVAEIQSEVEKRILDEIEKARHE